MFFQPKSGKDFLFKLKEPQADHLNIILPEKSREAGSVSPLRKGAKVTGKSCEPECHLLVSKIEVSPLKGNYAMESLVDTEDAFGCAPLQKLHR